MTEAQRWVMLGAGSAVSVAFAAIALVDFLSAVRESLRADPRHVRGTSPD